MRLLVTGSHGLVGTNIIPTLGHHFDVIPLDIEEWDINNTRQGEDTIRHHKPDVILNLAAFTDVDGCEDDPELAHRVNGEGPGIVAGLCHRCGVKLVHFSTDYIFDGEKGSPYVEEDLPNPQSVHDMSKLAGERNVLARHPSSLIIRAQWLYGKGGESFITKVARIAKDNGAAKVVDDQRGAPTYALDLAEPLRVLIKRDGSGIYHVANSGACTWFEFAREIFSCLHMDVRLEPTTSTALARKAKRPAYSVFDCTRMQRDTSITMRYWQEALRDYLGQTH